jgi:poly-gamma-glutamate synthesis protein (capsule biosynthesis protein)
MGWYAKKMKKKFIISLGIISVLVLVLVLVFIIFSSTKTSSLDILPSKQKETISQEVVSFVSPHHLVAKEIIENIFQKVAEKNKNISVESIILVSPNHKNAGNGWVAVSGEARNIENAIVEPNTKLVEFLVAEKLAYRQDEIFHGEHGIENLLPYAKKYFPQAKITSLMIGDGYPDAKAQILAEKLAGFDKQKTILILSADFSHYIGKTISEFHDQKAISVLSNLELEKAKNMDIDCPGGLYLLMKYSALKKCEQFNLVDNANSAKIYKQDFIAENTSYITGYYSTGTKKIIENASLFFAGDVMLDRQIRTVMKNKSVDFLTEKMKRIFLGPDEIIFNLEGPVTNNNSVSQNTIPGEKNHTSFTFDFETTKNFLKNTKTKTVFLGNNHIWDFGQVGWDETRNFLAKNNINYFGDAKKINEPAIKKISGKKVAFVAFNQFLGNNSDVVLANISELKKTNDFVVLYAHWGIEYARTENEKQKTLAHNFIDAGADLVIGSHPHVVEPIEIYKNKAIFYSLGNFIFDQYFSPETMEGLAVGMSMQDDKLDFYLSPLSLNRDGSTTISAGKKKDDLLFWLAENSNVSLELKNDIKSGHFQVNKK